MPAAIAIVADDLTGAADTAVGFLRSGGAGFVTWPEPGIPTALIDQADVLAIDAQTRTLDAVGAAARTADLVTMLRRAGVATLYKKVDSTLRGHIGEEVRAALTSWHSGSVAIVAPAFPRAGRTTMGGRQLVDGIPLDRPAIQEILAHAGISTIHADLACVRGGSVSGLLAQHRGGHPVAVVCDAESDDDLRIIARSGAGCGRAVVWVGSGGLAANFALSGASFRDPRSEQPESEAASPGPTIIFDPAPVVSSTGPVLIVVGSATGIAAGQVAHIAAAGVRHLAPASDDRTAWMGCAHAVEEALRRGEDVVVSVAFRCSLTSGPLEHDSRIAAALGELVRPFAELVGSLVVTGG
ncbi:MAG: four-carbon acid sugar kinase family protein, partial [Acidobacteriota bacterium]